MHDDNYFLEVERIHPQSIQATPKGAVGRLTNYILRGASTARDTAYNALATVCDTIETPFGRKMSTMALAFGLGLNIWIYSNIYETEKFIKEHNSMPTTETPSSMPTTESRAIEGDFSNLLYIIEEPNKTPNPKII